MPSVVKLVPSSKVPFLLFIVSHVIFEELQIVGVVRNKGNNIGLYLAKRLGSKTLIMINSHQKYKKKN